VENKQVASLMTKLDANTVRAVETVLNELSRMILEEAASNPKMSEVRRLLGKQEARVCSDLGEGVLRLLLRKVDPILEELP
jgi:hypothetical protein